MYFSHRRGRTSGQQVSSAIASVFLTFVSIGVFAAAALAGSLEDYQRADRPAITKTVEEDLTAINDYTAALDNDLTDEQLTVGQRAKAIFQRAYHWMTLYKCDEAIPGFSTLIDGTDPRVGQLNETDPLFATSYKWRAVCRYTTFDVTGAMADIKAARSLQPSDYTIRRMDLEIMLSNLPLDG